MSLEELKNNLKINVDNICTWIKNILKELFLPHKRRWADEATKTAILSIWKFI
ncbi:hypothetical protein [Gemella cuniculi]|uniref:hypothetical protein n=1 Tax=Gemella cuniculi TaxID=150240 RepID=UPI0003FC5B47